MLGTARNDEVVVAGAHLQTRLDDRLQTRSAAPIDLHAGNGHRQARIQCDHATDRGCLAVRIAVAEDHVVHHIGRDSGRSSSPFSAVTPRSTAVSDWFRRRSGRSVCVPVHRSRLRITHLSPHYAQTNIWA